MSFTNALSLPRAFVEFEVSTNEDWIDTLVYLIDSDEVEIGEQLDLRGIRFAMHVRRAPPESEVVIEATTENGQLQIGEPPDYGYLIIWVPHLEMMQKFPGAYVGDIIATDGVTRRVFIQFSLNIIQGITRGEGVKWFDSRTGQVQNIRAIGTSGRWLPEAA